MSSIFVKLFGRKKNQDASSSSPGATIQKLREMEELLGRKQEHLESKIAAEVATAKKYGTKNKRAALSALKRKKRYEAQLAAIDGTLTTIELQREALESTKTNSDVLNTMSAAAKTLKSAQQNMSVDKVHEVMDDIAEQQEVAAEISDAICNPIGFGGIGGNQVDEDELEKELEALEQEELDNSLLHISTDTNEPTTTTTAPKDDDDAPSQRPRPPPAETPGSSKPGTSRTNEIPSTSGKKSVLNDPDEENAIKQLEAWASS